MRREGTLRRIIETSPERFELPRALYIHVPFCRSRCSYCDFHSFDSTCLKPGLSDFYAEALGSRISSLGRDVFSDLETVYIGGGTPTALSDTGFASLLGSVRDLVAARSIEWTVEANPESLSAFKIQAMKDAGVTRISLGVQSMDDGELALLGRRGTADLNEKAIRASLASGLSVSADLIAGLPADSGREGKTRKSRLLESVRRLVGEGIAHLSIYDLTVEEGTPLAARMESGALSAMDEDEAYDERKAAEALLEAAGFHRYEVSNFAREGARSRHNAIYWEMLSYLGLGSGAVSTLSSGEKAIREGLSAALRITETRDLEKFLSGPDPWMEFEAIPAKVSAFETVMMGLRTARGVDSVRFARRFGSRPELLFPSSIGKWGGLFELSEKSIRLDGRGMDILNSILVDIGTEIDSAPDFRIGGNA